MKTFNHALLQEPIGNHSQHVSYFIEETTIGLQMNLPKKITSLIKSKMRLIL